MTPHLRLNLMGQNGCRWESQHIVFTFIDRSVQHTRQVNATWPSEAPLRLQPVEPFVAFVSPVAEMNSKHPSGKIWVPPKKRFYLSLGLRLKFYQSSMLLLRQKTLQTQTYRQFYKRGNKLLSATRGHFRFSDDLSVFFIQPHLSDQTHCVQYTECQ